MTLFQILSRRVATGKMKVTRKLLNRLRRETGGKACSKPPKPRRRKRGGFTRALCAAFAAALALPIWIITAQQAAGAQASAKDPATSGYSAAALFNQANACARQGKTGLAILDYERARLLSPSDADIAANLHFVRAKAGLPDTPETGFTRRLAYARPNTLAWLGSFGLALASMSLLLGRLHPQRRLAFRSLTVLGAGLLATAMAGAITIWPRVNEAVVIARSAPARTAPASAAEPAFQLREGETVTVCAEHQDFALVKTSAGRSGWVTRTDLSRVVPQSGNPDIRTSAPLRSQARRKKPKLGSRVVRLSPDSRREAPLWRGIPMRALPTLPPRKPVGEGMELELRAPDFRCWALFWRGWLATGFAPAAGWSSWTAALTGRAVILRPAAF